MAVAADSRAVWGSSYYFREKDILNGRVVGEREFIWLAQALVFKIGFA